MRIIILFLLTILFGCEDENHKYEVKVTYTTGQRDTITMIQPHHPKVEKNGCLYDYSERTYICGVRKIVVRETGPDE